MDRQTILKEYYRAQISALLDSAKDTALLELIYKLLIHEQTEEKENVKN